MFVTVLDIVIGGLLLGGIYAIISVGFSLQYGVARVLNISHGEFIMLSAFITWSLFTIFNINPLIGLIISSLITFIIGYLLHRTLYKTLADKSETKGIFEANSMLVSFGLLFIIQNIVLFIWGSDIRGYSYLNFPVNIFGAKFAANRLLTLVFAVGVSLIFYFFLMHTRMGKAIRAAAQDAEVAELMGVNIKNVLAICFGFGAMMAGVAGALISMSYQISATMGLQYTVIAMIVVVLGGLGSIVGSFFGGFILGLVGSIVSYIEPSLSIVAYYIIFMILLLVKPTGIMGR